MTDRLIDYSIKAVGYFILLIVMSRFIFLLGGGFAFLPVNDGTGCYSVSLFNLWVYEEAPCPSEENK